MREEGCGPLFSQNAVCGTGWLVIRAVDRNRPSAWFPGVVSHMGTGGRLPVQIRGQVASAEQWSRQVEPRLTSGSFYATVGRGPD